MFKFKTLGLLSLSVILSTGILTGCTKKEAPKPPTFTPEELKVQFVPSQNPDAMAEKVKPLEKLLGDKLGIPVKVSVSPNYNTIIEAMDTKKIDIGFLPPTAYVIAKDKKSVNGLLQAQRYGVREDGSNTKDLVDNYKSMIIVKKSSPINTLSDLKGKKVAWQDITSTSGYVYPAAEMIKAGIDPEKDVKGETVTGHDKGVISVLNESTDAAVVFEDARNLVKKEYPNVFTDTKVIYRTQGIPNDVIAVRSDMDSSWKEKITTAFVDISKDPEGQKVIQDIYAHIGYVKLEEKNFDILREYQKAVEKD